MTTQLLIRRLATLGAATVLVAATTTLGGTATALADTGGGATGGCGDYCPTTPGAPSGNGNGNANDPAQGTVGNADDKNPPGQFKNGGDPNGGFECDQNNGIAQGNPAHTGCAPTPPPVPPTPQPTCTPTAANNFCDTSQPDCATTSTCPVTPPVVITPSPTVHPVPPAIVPPAGPVPVAAGKPAQVLGDKITRVLGTKIVKHRTPAKAHVAASTIATLPHTGAPVGLLLELGLTAIGLGILLSVAGRRRYLPRFAG